MTSAAQSGRLAREPAFVHVDHNLVEAAIRMRDADYDLLFAVDGDELVGSISAHDIVTRAVAEQGEPETITVLDIMNKDVPSCRQSDKLERVSEIMVRREEHRLAVLNECDELVGLITASDIARERKDLAVEKLLVSVAEWAESDKDQRRRADPAGGRARGAPQGDVPSYAERPRLRRPSQKPD